MPQSRFTEERKAEIVRERRAGADMAELRRGRGVSSTMLHKWRSPCGGMGSSEARRPRGLEAEKARSEVLLAEMMPEASCPNDLLGRNFQSLLAFDSANALGRQPIDRPRGGLTIETPVLADARGHLIGFRPLPGQTRKPPGTQSPLEGASFGALIPDL